MNKIKTCRTFTLKTTKRDKLKKKRGEIYHVENMNVSISLGSQLSN